jgi:hypothetical protein
MHCLRNDHVRPGYATGAATPNRGKKTSKMGIFFAGKRLKRGAFDDKAAGTLSLVLLVISFMTLSVVYTLNQRQARIGG